MDEQKETENPSVHERQGFVLYSNYVMPPHKCKYCMCANKAKSHQFQPEVNIENVNMKKNKKYSRQMR